MNDPILIAENVRLTSDLRRTRIELAKALVVINDIEQFISPELDPFIYDRIQRLWKDLNERI